MGDEEQRVHARIHVSTSITVAATDGNVEAQLRDLSKGGARFVCAKPVGRVGETIELFLPSLIGEAGPTEIEATLAELCHGRDRLD